MMTHYFDQFEFKDYPIKFKIKNYAYNLKSDQKISRNFLIGK